MRSIKVNKKMRQDKPTLTSGFFIYNRYDKKCAYFYQSIPYRYKMFVILNKLYIFACNNIH